MSKQKETSKPELFQRNGYSTPVLWRNKSESKDEFLKRMNDAGFENLDKVEKHFTANEMALHVGSADNCKYCARESKVQAKPAKTSEVSDESPSEEEVPKSSNDELSKLDEIPDKDEVMEKSGKKKVDCPYCGKQFTAHGLKRHMKKCPSKPDDTETSGGV